MKSLLLIWRDKNTKSYFHIGTLTYDGDVYTFEYTHHSNAPRKIQEAMKYGYRLHPVFPKLKKKYSSKSLFPTFHRRIPSSDRVDYDEILDDLQLRKDADRMDILQKTRGIVAGDPYFFEEPLRLNQNDNLLSMNFYINGMRYRDLPDNWSDGISIGDKLYGIHEPAEMDNYAIQLHSKDGLWLGYVPAIYTGAIHALLERNIKLNFIVTEKRPHYTSEWWLRVAFTAELDMDKDNEISNKELNDLVFYVA